MFALLDDKKYFLKLLHNLKTSLGLVITQGLLMGVLRITDLTSNLVWKLTKLIHKHFIYLWIMHMTMHSSYLYVQSNKYLD